MPKPTVAIYPYDIDLCSIVRHEFLLPYRVEAAIAPIGFGFDGQDAGTIDGGQKVGLSVSGSFIDELDRVDTVLFDYSIEDIFEKILLAIRQKKNIRLLRQISNGLEGEIIKNCELFGVSYKNFTNQQNQEKLHHTGINDALYDIDTPLILVCGLSDTTLKFETQIALSEALQRKGYKVSLVGSRLYSSLFGGQNFPVYMFEKHAEYEKILHFNGLLKQIEISEKPDVFVVGIPGGIIPFDKVFNNEYGWLAYLISNAINPDITVLSMPYNEYSQDFVDNMYSFCKYRYGFESLFFVLSNIFQDITDKDLREKKYIRVNSDVLCSTIGRCSFRAFDILTPGGVDDLTESIITELASNVS